MTEMQAINPAVIVPMHCTGERFIEMVRQNMPDRVVYASVGSRYTFGA
jgi:7,8-dihydropterin-6-yl-methyl-4-(beta-D-ribofuranosyl)aminobenzene 5'-phosphate synthase